MNWYYRQKVSKRQYEKAQDLNVDHKHPLGSGDFMAEDFFCL